MKFTVPLLIVAACLFVVSFPMACVEIAKETGLLVREDCRHHKTRTEKIACGKGPVVTVTERIVNGQRVTVTTTTTRTIRDIP